MATKAQRDRLVKATDGRERGTTELVGVTARDLAAVAADGRNANRDDDVAAALHGGATAVRPTAKVFVRTEDLFHLLDLTAPPAPAETPSAAAPEPAAEPPALDLGTPRKPRK